MFGKLPKGIAERTDLPMGAKVLYAMLMMHQNPKTGQCNPSQRTLAKECGASQTSICRNISKLKDAGLVAIQDGNYMLPDEPVAVQSEPVANQDLEPVAVQSEPVANQSEPVAVQGSDSLAVQSDSLVNQSDSLVNQPYNEKEKKRKEKGKEVHTDDSATALELVDFWDEKFPTTKTNRNQQHRLQDQNALLQLLQQGKTAGQIRAKYDHIERDNLTRFYWRPYRLVQRIDQGRGPLVFDHLESQKQPKSKESPSHAKVSRNGTPMADMADRILARRNIT